MKIIYEDADVLVLDKPAGLVVHGDGRTQESTLSDWILEHYPELEKVGEPFETKVLGTSGQVLVVPRPGIVHRLDRDTSGLIIIAKTPKAFDYLRSEFKNHRVKKEYIALVYGHIETDSGVIDTPIGKSKKDFRQREATLEAGGKMRDARTVWEVRERLTDSTGHKYTLIYVRPETGRTHQIRAHMKSISHPVACDSLYAHGRICPVPLTRHALHAAKLSMTLPSGKQKLFESELPADFKKALDFLVKL
ncbi:MAG: RluA family pseudouridine synthase [Patescibacteria group bacterium]